MEIAEKLASEVINTTFVNFFNIELEIIAAHLYLEREIPFTFLSLIIDVYSIENHKM
jgi:hypothetical protein